MSLAAVPPLKVTRPYDLQTPIAAWLDEDDAVYGTVATVTGGGPHHPPKPHFRSMEVAQDLAKLQRLRTSIVDVLTSRNYDDPAGQLDTFYEYHASLLQCEQHGICVDEVSSPLELAWAAAFATPAPRAAAARARPGDDDDDAMDIDHYPNHHSRDGRKPRGGDNVTTGMEAHASITWERVNILWNIVALEAYLASTQPLSTRSGWMKAAVHLEKGAGILRHLRQDVLLSGSSQTSPNQSPFGAIDLSVAFCQSWESLLTAEAQRSSYEAFRCAARPRHFMLAKLATAAAPLYEDCDQSCRHDELTRCSDSQNSAAANPILLRQFLHSWKDYARAWGVWMRTKAEHHQACVHRDKRQLGLELARLHKALTLGGKCQDLCQQQQQQQLSSSPSHMEQQPLSLEGLEQEAKQTVDEMQDRYVQATQEQAQAAADNTNNNNSHVTVQPEDLPEIAPQLQVKVNQPIEKILPPLETPLFEDIMNPLVRRYVDLFLSEMDKLLFQMTSIAEEKTESARKALATVNLPHSLTAYRQEQAGGGIPEDLWYRVEAVQREKRVARLKQELWELRDIADAARHTYKVIKHQLEEDLAMDQLFREQHPNFEGHDAAEVQKTFRQSLENYDRLLVTAQDGDAVLLRRLEMLDTDPKYKLLQFQKSQLDRLLPGAGMVGPAIDTSLLSKLLVELSVLFREREMILSTMREELKSFDIHSRLSEVDFSGASGGGCNVSNNSNAHIKTVGGGVPVGSNTEAEREFRRILIESKESFNEIAYDIQENINKQTELVQTILVQNQKFMDARDAMQSSSSSDSCIVMIEDAIEEIEQLSKHLKEGKDFYDVVIPKLDKLKLQVGDVSARLTVERCEYEDNCRRNEQEAEDARMAASFAGTGGGASDGNDGGGSNTGGDNSIRRGSDVAPRAQAQPGVEQVSHGVPQVRVDDEKVASLVAMDFDPEKVVEALKKYDNNVEQALNELLSC